MGELYYCIQCVDRKTGYIGDFIHNGDKVAISPVFDNLVQLYKWATDNGYRLRDYFSVERSNSNG